MFLPRFDAGPGLPDEANDISRRSTDLQLLQAAGKEAGVTTVGSAELEDVTLCVISDVHLEWSGRTTEEPECQI